MIGWFSSRSSTTLSRYISRGEYSAQVPLNRFATAVFFDPGSGAERL